MRVVLSTYGSRGDVEPLAALAVELRALGAEATVCAPSDAEFAERLDAAGVAFVPVDLSARAMVAQAAAVSPEQGLPRRAAAMTAAQFDAVTAAARGGCDAIVGTGMLPAAAGARTAADTLGVPYRFVAFFPSYLPSPYHVPHLRPGQTFPEGETDNRVLHDLDARFTHEVFGPGLNTLRAGHGLPAVDDFRAHVLTDRPWLAADPTLAPWQEPADLDVVRTGAWFRTDDRPLPDEVEAFLDAGEPPVYVGFGSMATPGSRDTAQETVAAARELGRRVLVSRGWADLDVSGGKDDLLAVGEANHQALFRRVAAVVHHGGAGTTTTAALAAAPQLVVPQLADQPYWGRRVSDLGIGAVTVSPAPGGTVLTALLEAVLEPRVRTRAAAVADTVRTDGAATAAHLLTDEIAARPTAPTA
ncbi:glycosyltransferase [Streptomyces sp. NPDC090106]|uniref:glycosyltransferase n=1 Tax=Streptomyces sp. NPDC090106 TaxID=3365946 RepID=UPI0037F23982